MEVIVQLGARDIGEAISEYLAKRHLNMTEDPMINIIPPDRPGESTGLTVSAKVTVE